MMQVQSLCLLVLLGCCYGDEELKENKALSHHSAREGRFGPAFRSFSNFEESFSHNYGNSGESSHHEPECPFPYQQVGDNCYYALCSGSGSSTGLLSWSDATQYCQSTIRGGGNLAIFENANEFADAIRYIYTLTSGCNYWIGGYNNAPTTAPNPQVWTWINNQRMPMGVPFWAAPIATGLLPLPSYTSQMFAYLDSINNYFINVAAQDVAPIAVFNPLCQIRLHEHKGHSHSGENQYPFMPYFRSSLNDDDYFQQRLLNPFLNLPSPHQASQFTARSQLPFNNKHPGPLLRRNQHQKIFNSQPISGGSRTPTFSGSRAPVHFGSSRTPIHSGSSRTPIHSGSSRTPIHSDSSRTPIMAPQYRNDPILSKLGVRSSIPVIAQPLNYQLIDKDLDKKTEADNILSDLQSTGLNKEESSQKEEEDLEEDVSISENSALLSEYLEELEKNQTGLLPKEKTREQESNDNTSKPDVELNIKPKVHDEKPMDEPMRKDFEEIEALPKDAEEIDEALPKGAEEKDGALTKDAEKMDEALLNNAEKIVEALLPKVPEKINDEVLAKDVDAMDKALPKDAEEKDEALTKDVEKLEETVLNDAEKNVEALLPKVAEKTNDEVLPKDVEIMDEALPKEAEEKDEVLTKDVEKMGEAPPNDAEKNVETLLPKVPEKINDKVLPKDVEVMDEALPKHAEEKDEELTKDVEKMGEALLNDAEKNVEALLPKVPEKNNDEVLPKDAEEMDEALRKETTRGSDVEGKDEKTNDIPLSPMNEGKISSDHESAIIGQTQVVSETDLKSDDLSLKQEEHESSATKSQVLPQQVDPSTKESINTENFVQEMTSNLKEPLLAHDTKPEANEAPKSVQKEAQGIKLDENQENEYETISNLRRVTFNNEAPKIERRRPEFRDPFAPFLPGMISDIVGILRNIDQTYKPRYERY